MQYTNLLCCKHSGVLSSYLNFIRTPQWVVSFLQLMKARFRKAEEPAEGPMDSKYWNQEWGLKFCCIFQKDGIVQSMKRSVILFWYFNSVQSIWSHDLILHFTDNANLVISFLGLPETFILIVFCKSSI